MKVLLVLSVCVAVAAASQSQFTNPEFNDVPNVQLQFHPVVSSQHRNKRKIIDYRFAPARKWPTKIQIYLDDKLSDDKKRLLRTILKDDFEANTCIRFPELNATQYADHQFMWFKDYNDMNMCKAYIGRNNDTETFNGQPVFLGSNCFNYRGTLVHMVAATLGMYNEVQRPDRDHNIILQKENIKAEGLEYFRRQSDDVVHYHGSPYDFGSAVHYAADAWLDDGLKKLHFTPSVSDDKSYTVRPKDPRLFRLLGQKSELSFYDILVLNSAYCASNCGDDPVTCSNGGYPDPNACAKCKCPDGFSGNLCEDFAENVANKNHNCTSQDDIQTVTDEEQCVSSPGYDEGEPYVTGDQCTWVLESPENTYMDMWFHESRFALPYTSPAYSFCLHWVEIKYKGIDSVRGQRFCSLDALKSINTLPTKFKPMTSESNKVMVIMKTPQAHLLSEYDESARVGFKLCFKRSSTTPPTGPMTPSTTEDSMIWNNPSSSTRQAGMALGSFNTETPSHAKTNLVPLIVGIIAALLLLLIIFGVIIVVLLYKRKRKHVPPVEETTGGVSAMENPGYAHAPPVVTYHNPDSEKKMDVLDAFGVSMGDLPPKYEDVPPEDNLPRYTYAYNTTPVHQQSEEPVPEPPTDYDNAEILKNEVRDEQAGEGPEYQNAISIQNLRSKFEQ